MLHLNGYQEKLTCVGKGQIRTQRGGHLGICVLYHKNLKYSVMIPLSEYVVARGRKNVGWR